MSACSRLAVVTALSLSLGACRPASAQSKAPGLEDLPAGTGVVKLGMTEEQVAGALGSLPERRREKGRETEAAYRIAGAVPGTASAFFLGGPLMSIEFSLARLDDPPLPRVSKATAESLSLGPLALKAIHNELRMNDVVKAAGMAGRRVSWKLYRTFDAGKPGAGTRTTWLWEVEPGGKVLIVVESNGQLEQPFVRDLKRP